MLIQMIRICRIVMSLDVPAKAEGLSKPSHCAFGVIEVGAGESAGMRAVMSSLRVLRTSRLTAA